MPVSTFDWYPAQAGDLYCEIANRGKESIKSRGSVRGTSVADLLRCLAGGACLCTSEVSRGVGGDKGSA